MNKQRKVLITTTYNEMGIIIDTKAEEVAQPGWIPCDEALPIENGRYLCTNTALGAYIIDFDIWADGSWWRPEDRHIAWMPLPEPYQKEDQNGTL